MNCSFFLFLISFICWPHTTLLHSHDITFVLSRHCILSLNENLCHWGTFSSSILIPFQFFLDYMIALYFMKLLARLFCSGENSRNEEKSLDCILEPYNFVFWLNFVFKRDVDDDIRDVWETSTKNTCWLFLKSFFHKVLRSFHANSNSSSSSSLRLSLILIWE